MLPDVVKSISKYPGMSWLHLLFQSTSTSISWHFPFLYDLLQLWCHLMWSKFAFLLFFIVFISQPYSMPSLIRIDSFVLFFYPCYFLYVSVAFSSLNLFFYSGKFECALLQFFNLLKFLKSQFTAYFDSAVGVFIAC